MALVKLKVSHAGVRNSWRAGTVLEVSDAEAERMVAAGNAELVKQPPGRGARIEATARLGPPPETAERSARETREG